MYGFVLRMISAAVCIVVVVPGVIAAACATSRTLSVELGARVDRISELNAIPVSSGLTVCSNGLLVAMAFFFSV